jgi:hypothetical protein
MFAHTKSVRCISLILNIVLFGFDFNLFYYVELDSTKRIQ